MGNYPRNWRRGRLSHREQVDKNNASQRFIAGAIDDPERAKQYLDKTIINLPPKRSRVMRPVDGRPAMPLEREVLAAVLQVLRNDPRVGIVNRQQSGLFQDGERFIRVGQKGVLDINGFLRGSGKYFELECKRNEQTRPDANQQARIDLIRRLGGIAGYCWSVESALALLP